MRVTIQIATDVDQSVEATQEPQIASIETTTEVTLV